MANVARVYPCLRRQVYSPKSCSQHLKLIRIMPNPAGTAQSSLTPCGAIWQACCRHDPSPWQWTCPVQCLEQQAQSWHTGGSSSSVDKEVHMLTPFTLPKVLRQLSHASKSAHGLQQQSFKSLNSRCVYSQQLRCDKCHACCCFSGASVLLRRCRLVLVPATLACRPAAPTWWPACLAQQQWLLVTCWLRRGA